MSFNFNLPSFFATKFQTGSFGSIKGFQPTSGYSFSTPSYTAPQTTGRSSASFFDLTELLSSFKAKFNESYLKSFGVSEPEIKRVTQPEEKKVYDSTVMQNYGIVCPVKRDADEDVKISLVAQNYGIMCPLDTIEKTEPKEPFKLADVDQNYGIVCPPKETKLSETKFRSDETMMFANYGIVCPRDVKYLNDIS